MALISMAKCRLLAFALAIPASALQADIALADELLQAAQPKPNAEEEHLAAIFERNAEREDELDPLSQLYRGEKVDPDALGEVFTDSLDRKRLKSALRSLKDLGRVDRTRLSPESHISYDVFDWTRRQDTAWLQPEMRALIGVRPFNHFGGLHVEFPSLMAGTGAVPFEDQSDYRRALQLNDAFVQVIENAILRFREGVASDVVESRITVLNMIGQIDALLAGPIEQSPFYAPVTDFPANVPASARRMLREDFAELIATRLNPAYRRLRDFLADEYLPAARESVGLSAMKGGDGLYRHLIERETTLPLDPGAIHQLGLREVERIKAQMVAVSRRLGFTGTLPAFFEHLRIDPRYHPQSRQQLIDGFAVISSRVDAQLPRFFSHGPQSQLRIEPFPAFREQYEAGASYYQGSPDGSRPGTFYFNTYDLPSRFLTGMTTLYLHEAMPGHHFQISLAQENKALPEFQRFMGNNAFVEGWALYAETLGYEMGLFDDPMQHWGTLDDEMLRAMRLVVDTGIHAMGWPREQAIDYMLSNSGMSRTDATAEVERYIANPAQALSYKIGSLTIQKLRRKAEAQLGAKFDIRAFHDQVLGSGALPLPILEAKIDGWIAAQL